VGFRRILFFINIVFVAIVLFSSLKNVVFKTQMIKKGRM
jgi:uncharacterized membrane protein YtjA (UPF0391 family)